MSLKNLLKVPKYGLFYFASDKSMSIVPTKNIVKVVKGDNTTGGSVIVVKYGKEELVLFLHVYGPLLCLGP